MFSISKFRTAAAAAVLAFGASAVDAATLSGTFTINIYNYSSGGVQSNADATAANVAAHAGNFLATVVYTGAINFLTTGDAAPTIKQFLDSAGGSYAANPLLNAIMSVGGFTTTTLFDIYGTFDTAVAGDIDHDDGVALYNGAGYSNLVMDSSTPTSPISSVFSADAGAFRLVYSAANGNPEVLNVDASPVPVPAAGFLLLGAVGGLAALRRRKAATA